MASALALIFAPPSDSNPEGRNGVTSPRGKPRDVALPADREIVQQVRAGSDVALEQLFHAHASGLVTFAGTYVRSDEIAWEIVQEVFLWVIAHRATWVVPGTVRAYLYSATRHRALNYLKHAAVERRWVAAAQQETPSVFFSEQSLLDETHRRALINAIAGLAESRRTALALRYGHDMSYTEIASVLGSSVKAVENQLNRTLKQLRDHLRRQGIRGLRLDE